MSEESVKVAVRVRPFNAREKQRDAKLIIDMIGGATTEITDPESSKKKSFTFDYSYWSHDGGKDDANGYSNPDPSQPNGKKFADQKKVFDDLGVGVLNNAWEGYNATLFAYGQTGSGKSYSVVGYGSNKGIIPLFCDTLFQQIDAKKAEGIATEFEVTFSMLEIYNEIVRDLLKPIANKNQGLKVRQSNKGGFYAEGLFEVPVGSYKDIENKVDEGTRNRTVAATNMNATSSRAHTIVAIKFIQKYKNNVGEETTKSSVVNLVDLAGSERAESTGATGDRLKEGAAINLSLTSLGKVISALAEKSGGNSNVRVPYRDSVLTKLLKDALGGNSKTLMIAALSPADINYDETLSTLRYADRAKQIKTKATVNEDPTEKLIRELQEENEKLKQLLSEGGTAAVAAEMARREADCDDDDISEEELAKLKQEWAKDYEEKMAENERQMAEMAKTFEERLAKEREAEDEDRALREQQLQTVPHFSNLNMDPQLSGKIIIFLDTDDMLVGNSDECHIKLTGASIQPQHARITRIAQSNEQESLYSIEKLTAIGRTLVNGNDCSDGKALLHHNDRVWLGTTQLFLFIHPQQRSTKETWDEVTFETAQMEMATKTGMGQQSSGNRKDAFLQEDMLEMGPLIDEANAISLQMNKGIAYSMVLLPPEATGALNGKTQIYVTARDLEKGNEWRWSKEDFIDRKCIMQEMYESGGGAADGSKYADPFIGEEQGDFLIGFVRLTLQPLSYWIEIIEQLEVIGIGKQQSSNVGHLKIEVHPCDATGRAYTEDDDQFVEKADELIGKDLHFKIVVESARGLPQKFTDIYVAISAYPLWDVNKTKVVSGTQNPNFNYTNVYDVASCDKEFVEHLKSGAVIFRVYGRVDPAKADKTKNAKQELMDLLKPGQVAKGAVQEFDWYLNYVKEKLKFVAMNALTGVHKMKKKQHEDRLKWFEQLVAAAANHNKNQISLRIINGILRSTSEQQAQNYIAQMARETTEVRKEVVYVPQESKTCSIM